MAFGLLLRASTAPLSMRTLKLVKDVLLMVPHHPGKFPQLRYPGVGRPPKPLIQILLGPSPIIVGPKPSEGLFQ